MRQYILDHQDACDGVGATSGKKYWRSLEELADSPAFRELVQREYPQQAENWDDPIERRTFLKLMGASLALAGLSGCVYQPPEKVVPYVKQPEEVVPSQALFFATAFSLGGVATPLLVRSNEGRPTKVEGNPDHPNNRPNANVPGSSATDIFSQASVLTLYDPDRSPTSLYRDDPRPWSAFVDAIRGTLDDQRGKQGAGLRFLTETISSPTLVAQLKAILVEFPQAKWHQYEAINNDNARAGAVMALGQPAKVIYDFSKADRVLSLDSDFLAAMPGMLRYARDFADKRRMTQGRRDMNRLYVIETTPSNTGAMADHCWRLRPSELAVFAQLLANRLGVRGSSADAGSIASWTGLDTRWIDAVVRDLQAHKGSTIVLAGREASPIVHALAHAMNDLLGNVGKTVFYSDPLEGDSVDQRQSLQELVNDIDGGRVEILVMLGGNPVYTTPADLKLDKNRLFKVSKLRVHLSMFRDETSELCHWHIPETHYLEAWSDARSFDGTATIVQPLIEPLYQSKSPHEFLAVFTARFDQKGYDIVRDYWRAHGGAGAQGTNAQGTQAARATSRTGGSPLATQSNVIEPLPSPAPDFENAWRKWVHDGFIPNTALQTKTFSPRSDWSNQLQQAGSQPQSRTSQIEIVFRGDPSIYDGRFANNGWLQELPKPLTKLTWDNVGLISPNTARSLGITITIGKDGGDFFVDELKVDYRGSSIFVPAWIMPGHPDNVITLHLGYGRRLAGRVGNGHGFNAYDLRWADSPWFGTDAQVAKGATRPTLAGSQLHFNMEDHNFSREDRDIVRSQSLADYLAGKPEGEQPPGRDVTLYPNYDYENQGNGLNYAWGMAIDLNNCIGCNACTIACQAENNIPVVGKDEVARSREMHWIRVDTYFKGDNASNPEATEFMPVPCMHCENAPCEPVCPVHATVHSAEGLNDMVYNRCVGTKYCSNNCPYKVRRFNFFLYQDWDTPTYQLMRNPDVTVRSRGVMEKCTYCVQRIQGAKIQAEIEGRKVRDGEIVTACQAVCPTNVIVFGDINDPNSRVSQIKAEQRNYSLLAELNTRPRTTYLSRVRNPNPEIVPAVSTTETPSHGD
ncbi:MAG TPA: TAT-variant-translocated molybdopterin oxidoreductase [Pyrinomonadaceae bacterium]|nr:TAT-variant-translocated molybdopterin oxidoreductase [Pyrinomonadaceae bacterium]